MTTFAKLIATPLVVTLACAMPAAAQLGSLGKALGKANDIRQDLTFTEAEEQQLGSDISGKLRDKYGVVQDRAVHRYVALVGSVLAASSSRPNVKWTFVVLDTEGVNAFAAPGGFIHITRGALGLIQNESELAGVLAHEIAHVTAKHTIDAIQKSKAVSLGAQATRRDVLNQAADRGYSILLENNFDRGDEMDADRVGASLANGAGYAPGGLGQFLTRLSERNKALKERSGLFASHPETKARIDGLAKVITSSKLNATALVGPRYGQSVSYKPATPNAAAAPSAAAQPSQSGGNTLGISGLGALGRERSSNQTVSSAGSRGVNPDRDAPGGPTKALVSVTVSAAEVAEFRKGIA